MSEAPLNLDFIDLKDVPFTVNSSRFLLRKTGEETLGLYYVRYEVHLEECLIATLPLTGLDAKVEVGAGHVSGPGWTVALLRNEARVFKDDPVEEIVSPTVVTDELTERGVSLSTESSTLIFAGATETNSMGGTGSREEFIAAADAVVENWMARCPQVRAKRQAMTNQCWWVLGTNQVALKLEDQRIVTAVVPSKVGYVGLWQWDAYFIALGLRHGDPLLAAEQIDIAFSPAPDGQLPDVVHEHGILASSVDLPASDIATLHAKSKTDTNQVVPLTKPPLAAWAAGHILRYLPPEMASSYRSRWLPIIRASHDWWLRYGPEQLPRYEHPYSSGLDDSPIFDEGGAVVSPDLIAYLINQQELLADMETDANPGGVSQMEATAVQLRTQLQSLWDDGAGTYLPQHLDLVPIRHRTIVSLLAVFAGGLEGVYLDALIRDIEDPQRFAAAWPLPTVSLDDPEFDGQEMWRGSTWVNTNYLVADGLERCGRGDVAELLRNATLDGVEKAGGPVEHWDPRVGTKARTSTVSFGWSAALYVDLAVAEASRSIPDV